jgi:hypothetical protein
MEKQSVAITSGILVPDLLPLDIQAITERSTRIWALEYDPVRNNMANL